MLNLFCGMLNVYLAGLLAGQRDYGFLFLLNVGGAALNAGCVVSKLI